MLNPVLPPISPTCKLFTTDLAKESERQRGGRFGIKKKKMVSRGLKSNRNQEGGKNEGDLWRKLILVTIDHLGKESSLSGPILL